MAKGPRTLPGHLKLLRGSSVHHPVPREMQPTVPATIPEPPLYLVGYAFDEWRRISAECARLRVLTSVDTQALAAYCQAYAVWRDAVELLNKARDADPETRGLLVEVLDTNGKPKTIKNPLVLIARDAADKMVKYAAEFGLTPSGRARLAAGLSVEKPRGKFEGYFAS